MLDTALTREYQQFLQEHNRGKSDSDGRPNRSPDAIARWAMDHDLPEKDGHVQFPDARIIYEDRIGREHTRDIEVETLNYRGAHAASKASSGFNLIVTAPVRRVLSDAPHLAIGQGDQQRVRYFPDRFPKGAGQG